MKRLTSSILAAVLVHTSLLAGVACAVNGNGLSAYPTAPNTLDEYGAAWFRYQTERGKVQADDITIANNTTVTKRVIVYPVDATATKSGALAMRNQSEPRTGVGSWIDLKDITLTLAPHEHRNVTFTMTVPATASVGDHVGGIIVQEEKVSARTTDQGVHIQVVSRLGVRVYETVPGTPRVGLSTKNFSARPSARMHFTLVLTNTGNMTLLPTGKVLLRGVLGLENEEIAIPPTTLLPQQTAIIELASSRRHIFASAGQAKLDLSYGGGRSVQSVAYRWLNIPLVTTIIVIIVVGLAILLALKKNFISMSYTNKNRGDNADTNRRR